MDLVLQYDLKHQTDAISAVCGALNGIEIANPVQYYENPQFKLDKALLSSNISKVQEKMLGDSRAHVEKESGRVTIDIPLNLDIKMETGTGKTYVYTKLMYELHKQYRVNKFIIAVPTRPIKANTEQFLIDPYVQRHFMDGSGYDAELEVCVLNPSTNTKGRSYFPRAVSNFVKGSCNNSKKIYVLLVNMQLLTTNQKRHGLDTGQLWRNDYDYGSLGFYRPFDAIRATRPIVIIDEPHRFSRDQKAFNVIKDEINPQCIVRFGATFPQITIGKGKNKETVFDYQNLLYDLNACEAFNRGLIKTIAKEHFGSFSEKEEKIKITSIISKTEVHIQHKQKNKTEKTFVLRKGDSLSLISAAFEGIYVYAIDKTTVEFSNGVVKSSGEEIVVDVYMASYQEQMLRLALERHFETEKENFCSRNYKIKTLALFFIDDISSYRKNSSGKKSYLLLSFEKLLKEIIEKTISKLDVHDSEYRAYLEASLADISSCHAGYFAQDNDDSDEAIANEIDLILRNKKELLSFRKKDGSYNTVRFLFSKWTLKEGWDNPNIFTITKLRSSGSEISKLQEVGRGLRLPVDENGNRISNEEFTLNYIVDFTEADFAEKLVNQINGEIPQSLEISEDQLKAVAEKHGLSPDALFDELYIAKQYIDRNKKIKLDKRDLFFAEYPEFKTGLNPGKIKNRNKTISKPIKIRKAVYSEIRELWEKINQRYLLFYDSNLEEELESAIFTIFEDGHIFTGTVVCSQRDIVKSSSAGLTLFQDIGLQSVIADKSLPYGSFLKQISDKTNIPIITLHKALCMYAKKHGRNFEKYLNENTIATFCLEFRDWRDQKLQGRFHYERSNMPLGATALTYADGTPRSEIVRGRIGTYIEPGIPSAKYLYDVFAYDSPLEKDNIVTDIDEVVVYGKIPRSSIAIPTITGGLYSPDFMYIIKRKDGKKELNLIVETKSVINKTDLRGTEKIKIDCAHVFFDVLKKDGYTVYFREQIGNKQMAQIIDEIFWESEK